MILEVYAKAYLIKAKIVSTSLFSKKGMILAPVIIPISMAKTTQLAIEFLLFLMITDLFTGILASYFEMRKESKVKLVDVVSSEKLKRSGVKFILYFFSVIIAYFIQEIFKIKTFTLIISDMKLNLVIGVIGFWCIVESYSIFFENFKKMGVDIKSTIKKITDLVTFLKDKSNDVCK